MNMIGFTQNYVLLPLLCGIAIWYLIDALFNLKRVKRFDRYYVNLAFFCMAVIGTSVLHINANKRIEKMEKENETHIKVKIPALTAPERALLSNMYRFGWYVLFFEKIDKKANMIPRLFSESVGAIGEVPLKSFNILKDCGYILPVVVSGRADVYFVNPDVFSIYGKIDNPHSSQSQLGLQLNAQKLDPPPGTTISESEGDSVKEGP